MRSVRGNQSLGAQSCGGRKLEPDRFIRKLDELQVAYKGVRRARPENPAAPPGAPQLVFLIGFPRSGTTLLDTVLLSHSRISVVEEKPMVQDMVRLARSWQAEQRHVEFPRPCKRRALLRQGDVFMGNLSRWSGFTCAYRQIRQVVADLEATVGQVLEFLGLEWEDTMADYKATALDRKRIGTPSYHQVVQPIYSRADGRWQRYRSHMQPVLPVLLKWADIYGYSGEPGDQ